MHLETWLLFCATETVLCFTPGPAVLLVISLSLARGRNGGIGASLGILCANVAYFVLSATSLGAVLVASWDLFSAIKWIGAGYLVWLGGRMILTTLTRRAPEETSVEAVRRPRLGSFSQGLIMQAANPKSLIFFTAILPQFIDPHEPIAVQVAIFGISSLVIEFIVLSLYVVAVHGGRTWARQPRVAAPLQVTAGALLVAAGIGLAGLRR